MDKTLLEKRILATLIWYDFLNFPLTLFEIWSYLIKEKNGGESAISLGEIEKTLNQSEFLKEKLGEKRGFYFLKGREDLTESRIFQNKLSIRKWQRLKRIIKIISFIPYVRMVSATGSMGFSHLRKESDLDVLIITAKNRIWLCRFLVTMITHILGVRRHKDKIANKICLNHYISEEQLEDEGKSLYTAYEYFKMAPVFGIIAYKKFISANKWLNSFLANPAAFQGGNKHILKESKFQKIIQKFFEICLNNFIGDFLEKFLGEAQEKRIKKDPIFYKKGGRVKVSRFQLEFHPDSPQKRILAEFNREAARVGLNEFVPQIDSGLLK